MDGKRVMHAAAKRKWAHPPQTDDKSGISEQKRLHKNKAEPRRMKIRHKIPAASQAEHDHTDSDDDHESEDEKLADPPRNTDEDEADSNYGDADKTQEFDAIKEELSQLSFEELQQLQEKLGTKVLNQFMQKGRPQQKTKGKEKKVFKRANKTRPMEISASRKPVSRFREVIPIKKKIIRDPRFDDLSGEYSEHHFKHNYGFLDDIKHRELQKMKQKLKKTTDREQKTDLQFLINRTSQQLATSKQRQEVMDKDKRLKKEEKEMVKQGKTPYYLKKSERQKLDLADKYTELKKTGKLDKYMVKKRKKNTATERKRML